MALRRCAGDLCFGVRAFSTSSACSKSDLISDVFVKQIRDLVQKQQGAGGLVNSNPTYKKQLDEQLTRLAQKFKLPSTEIVNKLDVTFDKPSVDSSVNTLLEGKTLDQLIAEEQQNYDAYVAEQETKKKEEQKRIAALSQAN